MELFRPARHRLSLDGLANAVLARGFEMCPFPRSTIPSTQPSIPGARLWSTRPNRETLSHVESESRETGLLTLPRSVHHLRSSQLRSGQQLFHEHNELHRRRPSGSKNSGLSTWLGWPPVSWADLDGSPPSRRVLGRGESR